MIYVETGLKKIPERCTKCKYSFLGTKEGGYPKQTQRFCSIAFKNKCCREIPLDYNFQKNNYEYAKPSWCPLKEL